MWLLGPTMTSWDPALSRTWLCWWRPAGCSSLHCARRQLVPPWSALTNDSLLVAEPSFPDERPALAVTGLRSSACQSPRNEFYPPRPSDACATRVTQRRFLTTADMQRTPLLRTHVRH